VGGGCAKDKDELITEEDKIKIVWKEYFEKLLNEEFNWNKEELEQGNQISGPSERTTVEEMEVAIKTAKDGKAPGPTGVMVEMLKVANAESIQWMTDLCSAVVSEGKIPEHRKKSWMGDVYKGKGDALKCGSYRGIKR
jgi:hypothetical protein